MQHNDDNTQYRAESDTRALLRVFDTCTPPGFQEQVMQRVHARLQAQQDQSWRYRHGWSSGRPLSTWSGYLLPVGVTLAFCLLLVSATWYTAWRKPPPSAVLPHHLLPRQAMAAPLGTEPGDKAASPWLQATAPIPAVAPAHALPEALPPRDLEPQGAASNTARSAVPSLATTADSPPAQLSPSPRRQKKTLRHRGAG